MGCSEPRRWRCWSRDPQHARRDLARSRAPIRGPRAMPPPGLKLRPLDPSLATLVERVEIGAPPQVRPSRSPGRRRPLVMSPRPRPTDGAPPPRHRRLARGLASAHGRCRHAFVADLTLPPLQPDAVSSACLWTAARRRRLEIVLIAIEGVDAATPRRPFAALAAALREGGLFTSVARRLPVSIDNSRDAGRPSLRADPNLTPAAYRGRIAARRSPNRRAAPTPRGGAQAVLTRDPTGETWRSSRPCSPGNARRCATACEHARRLAALLIARTRRERLRYRRQALALDSLEPRCARVSAGSGARLLVTGPASFSVNARAMVKDDSRGWRPRGRSTSPADGGVPSPTAHGSGWCVVLSGALAAWRGLAGLRLRARVTLGFGTALIGEAVD